MPNAHRFWAACQALVLRACVPPASGRRTGRPRPSARGGLPGSAATAVTLPSPGLCAFATTRPSLVPLAVTLSSATAPGDGPKAGGACSPAAMYGSVVYLAAEEGRVEPLGEARGTAWRRHWASRLAWPRHCPPPALSLPPPWGRSVLPTLQEGAPREARPCAHRPRAGNGRARRAWTPGGPGAAGLRAPRRLHRGEGRAGADRGQAGQRG